MNIIVMGPAGSGKSTQAEIIASHLHLPHIETGNIYRSLAVTETPLGKKLKAVLESGGLVDDETTFEIVDQHLAELTGGFVLDGFPRTLVQAQRELFPIDKVFYLNLPDSVATERLLLRKRADDTEDVIRERLRLYHERTVPILDYYRRQGKLVEIDATPTIEDVTAEILAKLQ